MSSLRNAVKRITHKERSQPRSRQKLGILEKKKDYKERAKDYHRKEDKIKALREKASTRNPDEFYFGMKRAQVQDGHHRITQQARQQEFDESVGADTIRIMKDQDLSYVRMQKQKDLKKAERLQSSLHYLEAEGAAASKKRKHTIFVKTKKEAEEFDAAEHFDTIPELVGRTFNRPRVETLKRTAQQMSGHGHGEFEDGVRLTNSELVDLAKQNRKKARKIAKARSSAYKEMEARSQRVAAMEQAEAHLLTEKMLAGKGRSRKIKAAENGQPAQYQWRRKRLR